MDYSSKINKSGELEFPRIPGMSQDQAARYVMMREALQESPDSQTAEFYRAECERLESSPGFSAPHVSASETAEPTRTPGKGGNSATGQGRPSNVMSDAQYKFIASLAESRDVGMPAAEYMAKIDNARVAMSKRAASQLIDTLKNSPWRKRETVAPKATPGKPATPTVSEGMYLRDGKIFKVQRAVHGSGNLYAKELHGSKSEGFHFEYARGAIRTLTPEHRMTLDQAKEFGALYGTCCKCARTLTDESSIAAGIGPICAEKF